MAKQTQQQALARRYRGFHISGRGRTNHWRPCLRQAHCRQGGLFGRAAALFARAQKPVHQKSRSFSPAPRPPAPCPVHGSHWCGLLRHFCRRFGPAAQPGRAGRTGGWAFAHAQGKHRQNIARYVCR